MSSLPQPHHNLDNAKSPNSTAQGSRLLPATLSDLGCKRGGLMEVPGKLKLPVTGESQKLTKLLLNVNIQRSFGPLQVVMSPENTVKELIKVAIETYMKEKRRPLLAETDFRCFELHYSQFSLESLKPEEKLMNLGSRNFFLCPKPKTAKNAECYDEANAPFLLTKFMDILL
ncbi:hypothetical protein LguiA_034198 [Lonicera macranthoides]